MAIITTNSLFGSFHPYSQCLLFNWRGYGKVTQYSVTYCRQGYTKSLQATLSYTQIMVSFKTKLKYYTFCRTVVVAMNTTITCLRLLLLLSFFERLIQYSCLQVKIRSVSCCDVISCCYKQTDRTHVSCYNLHLLHLVQQ